MKQLPKDFWVLCISTLLFSFSFNVILPELNSYLENMGEGENKWAILVPWAISALVLRPLSGKMADTFGRKPVVIFGALMNITCAFFYPFASALYFFLWVRFFHGFCAGFQPTGASALAADLSPQKIRGEAMGFFSISISLGFGIGYVSSAPIKSIVGMDGLFYTVAISGALSLLLILMVRETKPKKIGFKFTDIIPRPNEIIAPEVFLPAGAMMLITICTGFYMLLVPDIAEHLGMENKGWFFFAHMSSSLIIRYLAGRLSDIWGRRKTAIFGIAVFALASALMMQAQTVPVFIACGFIYGVGTGIISPTLMAWTTDLALPDKKGRGLATMWMGLELGIAVGTYGCMIIYANNPDRFPLIFGIATAILTALIIYLLSMGKKQERTELDQID